MDNSNIALHSGFINSAKRLPANIALDTPTGTFTYQSLFEISASIAAALSTGRADEKQLTAVLANRDLDAYSGILGILMSGHGYVPLNPKFPVSRSAFMLQKSECDTIILGRNNIELGADIVMQCPLISRILVPGLNSADQLLSQLPVDRNFEVIYSDMLPVAKEWRKPFVDPESIAYLLFTSGSTGEPKGVMVSHSNICRFLQVMDERYQLTPEDRVSQMFELNFDLSLFDMFMTWGAGARLCVPSFKQVLIPASYINDAQLTVWFSVPSTALLMKKLGILQPDSFKSLRISLFCGEALPCDVTKSWVIAAPGSIVENLYGPTELTLACTLYRWNDEESEHDCLNGMVPIGEPYPGMHALILRDDLTPVGEGEIGELALAGPQVALGYWKNPGRTSKSFITVPNDDKTYYRTGDLVKRISSGGPLICLGRLDQQIKIHGHRIELGDIESALKSISGGCQCIVLPWPINNGTIEGLVAFLESAQEDIMKNFKQDLSLKLPGYMIPGELRNLERLPLNANGKVDRNQLKLLLESDHE